MASDRANTVSANPVQTRTSW